jgi:hypothetical protein
MDRWIGHENVPRTSLKVGISAEGAAIFILGYTSGCLNKGDGVMVVARIKGRFGQKCTKATPPPSCGLLLKDNIESHQDHLRDLLPRWR